MPMDPNKNVAAEIDRTAKAEAAKLVMQLRAAGERFDDSDYVEHEIACALGDAYRRVKNWQHG